MPWKRRISEQQYSVPKSIQNFKLRCQKLLGSKYQQLTTMIISKSLVLASFLAFGSAIAEASWGFTDASISIQGKGGVGSAQKEKYVDTFG